MYLARDLTFGETHLDEDEFLDLERIPFDQLTEQVLSGEIKDAKTIAAVLKGTREASSPLGRRTVSRRMWSIRPSNIFSLDIVLVKSKPALHGKISLSDGKNPRPSGIPRL